MDAPVKTIPNIATMNPDKAKALQAALAQIEKQFGKGSIMRLDKQQPVADIKTVPTG